MHDRISGVMNDANAQTRTRSILLVEDDEVVRTLTAELLAELDFHVLEAEDAPAALTILQSEQPLDLLMTDICLPGMSGYRLMAIAQQLRPTLRGLFASGYGDSGTPEGLPAGDAQRVATICKPYSPALLRSTLRTMFDHP
jgi:CheY-like chemotaxis protein